MKAFILFLVLVSNSALALQVTNAIYNHESDRLEIQVQYTGGCFEHTFEMHLVNCALSRTENIGYVNVCDAKVVDVTEQDDRCKAIVKRQLKVSLESLSDDARPVLIGFESGVVLVSKKG